MYERKKRTGVMLCYPFEEKRLEKWEPPYLVQPKLDGVRCRALKTENGFLLLSSTEEVIFSVPHINDYLNSYIRSLPNELDGELYLHGWSFEDIYSVTSRTANLHPKHELIEYHAFDYVSEEAQIVRLANLIDTLDSHAQTAPLQSVRTRAVTTFDELMEYYHKLVADQYEGIIVRHYMAPYVKKRSTHMMKFKPKKRDAYKITGGTEEIDKHGNPKNSLGAFVCESTDGETFSIGSGLTHEQRKVCWDTLPDLIGMYCLVEYQHITPGRGVPRFPIFVSVITPEEASKYEE
jgi:ATP-dependent DNA ligase